MFGFLSPIDAASSLALLVLAIFGLVKLIIAFRRRVYLRKHYLAILHLDKEVLGNKMGDFLKSLKPPFTFEIAVHHLGKNIHHYLILPRRRAKLLASLEGINEVDDYHLFHHGGEHLGVYLKGGKKWPNIDTDKIDFSKVNEVGEGVAIQMVFGRRYSKKNAVNFRILISAPSSYQAKEILAAIKPAFPGFSMTESRGEDFLDRVNFRKFSDKEKVYWSLAG